VITFSALTPGFCILTSVIIAVTQPGRHSRRICKLIVVLLLCDGLMQRWFDLRPPGLAYLDAILCSKCRGSRRVEGIAISIWIEVWRRRASGTRGRGRGRTRGCGCTRTRCCYASTSAAGGLPISVVFLRGTHETSATRSTRTAKHVGARENIGCKVRRCSGRSRVI